ncbi:hypothetical protein CUMW_218610 [Citrus unshiu]|uniref:Uncharacterized protein n=1 Tax=Citrus unshiu TaxID=55188 RepID=A0A2H5QD73_CITUN|nr:hypothetical protein CUMW_218610 [Citrus unshiu]
MLAGMDVKQNFEANFAQNRGHKRGNMSGGKGFGNFGYGSGYGYNEKSEAIREIIKEVVETGVKVLDLMISITLKLLETLSQIGILPNQPVSFVSKLGILQMSAGYLLNSWLLSRPLMNPGYSPAIYNMEECLQVKLEKLSPLPSNCCIYRVPERLRQINEKAYTPQVVSIGPLHHGKANLQFMEAHKQRYLRYFLQRAIISFDEFVQFIKLREAELRGSYAEKVELSSDKFVEMILLDAACCARGMRNQAHQIITEKIKDTRIYVVR